MVVIYVKLPRLPGKFLIFELLLKFNILCNCIQVFECFPALIGLIHEVKKVNNSRNNIKYHYCGDKIRTNIKIRFPIWVQKLQSRKQSNKKKLRFVSFNYQTKCKLSKRIKYLSLLFLARHLLFIVTQEKSCYEEKNPNS